LGLFHFGYGMSFAFRCSRPDILGLSSLLLLFLAFRIEHPRIRYSVLFILAALTVWIGLQVALFASLALAAAWLLFRRTGLREILILSSGMAIGAGTLVLLLKWKGVLSYFLPIVIGFMGKHYAHSAHITISAKLFRVLRTTLSCYFEDFTTVLLIFGIIATLAIARSKLSTSTRSLMHYCLIIIFAVPAVFNVVGHYAFYYSYMLFIPALLAPFAGYSELATLPSPESRFSLNLLIFGFIVAAIAVGLPLRIALALSCGKLVSRTEIQRIVHSHINRHDCFQASTSESNSRPRDRFAEGENRTEMTQEKKVKAYPPFAIGDRSDMRRKICTGNRSIWGCLAWLANFLPTIGKRIKALKF